ncbi:gamma-glutamyltransferase [Paractinoplanes toevensis]|uniref:Gamma-glutamyltranspeptidase n=1 Tax=Paractinoplanes toevensis TaxID=571911 RepID=A0A919WAN9_9ACTN|nr:gamma-glutamyltransferase [Actinoplanes toevensis]GIM96729.1 gamma-glutamyltranspeptidase [Actinoplanes toevensis]
MAVAVAAPHPAAIEAARTVVAAGGNAFDAALAAAAALTVAYPHQCSVGGDLVAIVRPAPASAGSAGGAVAVLSIGAAAANVDVTGLRAAGPRMPFAGPQTVTVPGVVAGWAAIAELGARLPLAALLAPARALAADGVPVSPGLHRAILGRLDGIRADPGLRGLLLDDAGQPRDTLAQPRLAATLDAIATNWRSFYRGHLGHRLVAGLNAFGSPLSVADFAAHRAEVTTPLSVVAVADTRVAAGTRIATDTEPAAGTGTFARIGTAAGTGTGTGGVTWLAAPPPVQGATFLGIAGSGDLLTDARRAQFARDALLGDPRTGPVDLDGLMLRRPVSAGVDADGPKPAGDTVAVTAVDDDGTAVTLIQSVFQSFGSGILEPDTGIVLHNRGSSFSLDPDHPGRLAGGVRPPHTLCPTLAVGGDTVLALGCQGGRSQPWILAQVAADAFGTADPAGVLARPRWIIGAREIDREAPTLLLEPGTPDAARLAEIGRGLGLAVEYTAGPHDDAGHVQMARLSAGVLTAASDPRADGLAAVLP